MDDRSNFKEGGQEDGYADWRVESLARYTELDPATIQNSFKVLGDQEAAGMARRANQNSGCTAFMACAATWTTVGLVASAATSEWSLCGAFAAATAALTAGTVGLYRDILQDGVVVGEKILQAARRSHHP